MKRKKKLTFFVMLLLVLTLSAQEDHWALGANLNYDFQTNGLGAGIRAYIPVRGNLAFSPQFSYFFPFNTITEYYAGGALQYDLLPKRRWTLYPLIAAYYDRWINSSDFTGPVAKPNNFAVEAGIGLMRGYGCWRPFVEMRYDFKWTEFNAQAGILFFFRDCFKQSQDVCPAYF